MNLKKISLASLLLSMSVYGASIDHIQNYSAEYGGNPAQQAAINKGSSVYFNPAGITRLEEGLYIVGGLQYAIGTQTMTAGGREHDAELGSPIPNFALYKVDNKGAYFLTAGGVGGGAELEYSDSVPLILSLDKIRPGLSLDANNLLDKSVITGGNQYGHMTFGRAFNLNEKTSVSAAIRGVYGLRTLEADIEVGEIKDPTLSYILGKIGIAEGGRASIDSERTAMGLGFQLGINHVVNDRLNLAARFDSKVKLNFEADTKIRSNKEGVGVPGLLIGLYPVYADGIKTRRDLPAILAAGASYKVNDKLTTYLSGNYYFNSSATMDKIAKGDTSYDNGYEVSLGGEYKFDEKISLLAGVNYAKTGAPTGSYSATEYAIDSIMVGTGVKYNYNETTELTAAINHYFYDGTYGGDTKYEKEITSVGFNFVKKLR